MSFSRCVVLVRFDSSDVVVGSPSATSWHVVHVSNLLLFCFIDCVSLSRAVSLVCLERFFFV